MCEMASCAVGGSGVCMPVPEGCFEIYEPVCGCDGKTYSSQCHRQQAGMALDSEGECAPPPCSDGACKTCTIDSDCVAVQTTCCSCSMGGEEQAFNKDYADQFTPENCSPDLMCLAYYNCFGAPACVSGECQMAPQL